MSISLSQSYAQTDTKFTKSTGDDIKNNPITKNILKNIEIARKQFASMTEKEKQNANQQKLINDQRKAAQTSLQDAISKMNAKYAEFTPQNAFAKYVSGVNATHQAIYWDQFEYFNTKITLAKNARDAILKKGGTHFDAMSEYSRYAKMSKIEMLSVIKDLNIKHSFTDKETQSYFDANGKLPRVKDDLNAPCYGCKSNISKVKTGNVTVPITTEKIKPISQSEQNKTLKDKLSTLQKEFVNSKDITKQKTILQDMNTVLKQIQDFHNS